MATLIVPGEDFLKTVPLFGSTLRVNGVDGIVNVTDFAETLAVWKIKMLIKIEKTEANNENFEWAKVSENAFWLALEKV